MAVDKRAELEQKATWGLGVGLLATVVGGILTWMLVTGEVAGMFLVGFIPIPMVLVFPIVVGVGLRLIAMGAHAFWELRRMPVNLPRVAPTRLPRVAPTPLRKKVLIGVLIAVVIALMIWGSASVGP
jgi:hypothetical protein